MKIENMFPKTSLALTKPAMVARTNEMRSVLSRYPHNRTLMTVPEPNIVQVRTPNSPVKRPFIAETRKNSDIAIYDLFSIPDDPEQRVFQLMSKTRQRAPLRQVHEFLMQDLWSRLLQGYSGQFNIRLAAPVPYKIEGDELFMSRELGNIGDRLHVEGDDEEDRSDLRSFAVYLGALAKIKEKELLLHGDYRLHHIIMRPANMPVPFVKAASGSDASQIFHSNGSEPSASVVDLENSVIGDKTEIEAENERLFLRATNYFSSVAGLNRRDFEHYYASGFVKVKGLGLVQQIIKQQYERWGFSVDLMF